MNVWLALTWSNHIHTNVAWKWLSQYADDELLFCRFTQLGLLRLLTTSTVMGDDVLTVGAAWKVYERWTRDSRVRLRPEASDLDKALRQAIRPIFKLSSPKALADRYLIAVSETSDATLVTFDRALASACQEAMHPVTLLKTEA